MELSPVSTLNDRDALENQVGMTIDYKTIGEVNIAEFRQSTCT